METETHRVESAQTHMVITAQGKLSKTVYSALLNIHRLNRNNGFILALLFIVISAMSIAFEGSILFAQNTSCSDQLRLKTTAADSHKQRQVKYDRAREFLWSHWSERRCGELLLTTGSKEGLRTDSKYAVNTAEQGEFVIKVISSTEKESWPTASPAQTDSWEIDSLTRIRPKNHHAGRVELISGNEPLPPSQYRLQFRDREGHVITEF